MPCWVSQSDKSWYIPGGVAVSGTGGPPEIASAMSSSPIGARKLDFLDEKGWLCASFSGGGIFAGHPPGHFQQMLAPDVPVSVLHHRCDRAALFAEVTSPTVVPWPRPQLRPSLPLPLTASSEKPPPTVLYADSPAEAKSLPRLSRGLLRCGGTPSPGSHVRDEIAQGRPRDLVHGDDTRSRRSRGLFCGGGPLLPSPSTLRPRPQRRAPLPSSTATARGRPADALPGGGSSA